MGRSQSEARFLRKGAIVRSSFLGLALVALTGLSSCGMATDLDVVRGNRLFRSGRIHEASAMYLRAGAGIEPVASYDLANAFVVLGEDEPAMELYGIAIESGRAEVAARACYNVGVIDWGKADYAGAARAFREGLSALALRQENSSASMERASRPLRAELSRAYEMALAASERRKDAGQTERGAFSLSDVSSEAQAFATSRYEERTLFLPGRPEPGTGVDH